MAYPQEEEETLKPNLPVVPVRGVSREAFWLLCERYQVSIEPASPRELKLAEVIIELEELAENLGRRK